MKKNKKVKQWILRLMVISAILTAAIIAIVSTRAYALDDYYVTEDNSFSFTIEQNKASSTASYRYATVAWYLFPEAIRANESDTAPFNEYYNGESINKSFYDKKGINASADRSNRDTSDPAIYRDTFTVSGEKMMDALKKWWKAGAIERSNLEAGITLYASRPLNILKNGKKIGTVYSLPEMRTFCEKNGFDWTSKSWETFRDYTYDQEIQVSFSKTGFSIVSVDEKDAPVGDTDNCGYGYSDIYYGETTDTIQYPGKVSGYEYIGYEITAGGKTIKEGKQTTVNFTAKYSEIKENDVVLTFHYKTVQESAGFVPTATPTPTAPPTPTPTLVPGVTATPTPIPTELPKPTNTPRPTATPKPDAITEEENIYHFTTDMGYTIDQIASSTQYTVASFSGSTAAGTLSGATATKRSARYQTGTDDKGNTWYFIANGTNATYVHPAIYNGYHVDSEEVRYITELIFPSTITSGSTVYTVTSIGGGTSKYHTISDNQNGSSSDPRYYNYYAHYGVYSYFKESGNREGTVGYYTKTSEDHEYFYGVLGNGCIETKSKYENVHLTNGETISTNIIRNYYVYNTTLKSVTIPDTVTWIADYAFQYCQNLSEIRGGAKVQTIGESAFATLDNLRLTASSMDISYFWSDDKIAAIYIWNYYNFYNEDSKWTYWASGDMEKHIACDHEGDHFSCRAYEEEDTELMLHTQNVAKLTETRMKFPEFPVLRNIRECAFEYRKNLWDVTLSDTVYAIYYGAFYGCELDSIRIPGTRTTVYENGIYAGYPTHETLGTNKAGENRTIIYTIPSAYNTVLYGRTWSNYYRLKAGYTITYHANNGSGQTVEQMTDIGFYEADWAWCSGDIAINRDGTIYRLKKTNSKIDGYSILGTLAGGFAGVENTSSFTYNYVTDESTGTTIETTVSVFYLRDGEGNLWCCAPDSYTSNDYTVKNTKIPAGAEVLYQSGYCHYLDETGAVFYYGPIRNRLYTAIKNDQQVYKLMYFGSSLLACGSDSWFKINPDAYSYSSGVTAITIPLNTTPLVCGTECMVDTAGNFWRLSGTAFIKLAYTGNMNLASLQYINGRIYDESMHLVSLSVSKSGNRYSPVVMYNQSITGEVKESFQSKSIFPYGETTYYWMKDGKLLDGSTLDGSINEEILPGKSIKKITRCGYDKYTCIFVLTEDGAVYDVSSPKDIRCLSSSGRVYTDIDSWGLKNYTLLAVAEDGTLWGSGEKLYKDKNGNWVDSVNLTRIPDVTGAMLVSGENVYFKEGVYSRDSGAWSLAIIDFGSYYDASLWGYMFENPGLTCTEWNTEADGTGNSYHPEDKVSLTEDLSLYAVWGTAKAKTAIQYDRNGGAGSMSATTLGEEETTATVKINQFVREGYHFTVWNTRADGSGTAYKEGDRITVVPGTITTLYAQWKAEDYLSPDPEVFSYTLVYMRYPYGTAINEVWKSKTMSYLEVETVEGQPYEVALGYQVSYRINTPAGMSTVPLALEKLSDTTGSPVFNKWRMYTKKDGAYIYQGKQYRKGSTISGLTKENGGMVYLYPTWEMGESTVILPYTEAKGYNFKGWNESADGKGLLHPVYSPEDADNIGTFTPVRDIVLYGDWEPLTYLVTLDDRGATSTGHIKSVTMTFDKTGPDIIIPTKTGYTFQGYYTEIRGNGTKYYDETGKGIKTWTITKDMTLYAYWVQDPVVLPKREPTVLPVPVEEKVLQGELGGTGGEALLYADDYNPATGALTDLQPYLTYDTEGTEGWIPGTELLSFRAKVAAWLLDYTFQRCSGSETVRIYVTVPYRTQYEKEDETLVISELKNATYCVEVPKVWSYWKIVESTVYYPESVMVENAALKNGGFTVAVDWKLSETSPLPHCTEIRYGEKDDHIFWENYDEDGTPMLELSVTTEQYFISETVNSLPDVEQYLSIICANAAWTDNRKAKVKSDLLRVNERIVLSDALSETGAGMEPENFFDCVESTVYPQLYKSGIELNEYTANGIYPTSVTVNYKSVSETGGTKEKTKTLTNVNALKIHTPVACQGVIVDGMSKTEHGVCLDLKEALNFFTLRIDNTGTHKDSPGYGTKDFTWALSGKSNIALEDDLSLNQIRFSFDVYVSVGNKLQKDNKTYDTTGDYLLQAGTWMTIGKQDVTVYVPCSLASGSYPVHFRTIAVNCPKMEESGYLISGREQKSVNTNPEKYAATDGFVVSIHNSLQDFRITDTADPLAKKVLSSGCQALTLKKGYPFFFDFLTLAEQENDAAQISIVPEFYWISPDENIREKAVLYQKGAALNGEVCYSLNSLQPKLTEEDGTLKWRWAGKGYIPADVLCKTLVDGETRTDGYLVIAFGIRWKGENRDWYTFTNWKNTELAADAVVSGWNYYRYGDVIRYDLSKSISSDYEVGGLE